MRLIALKYMPVAIPLLNLFSIRISKTGVVLLNIVTAKLNAKDTPEYLTLNGNNPTRMENMVHDTEAIMIEKINMAHTTGIK